MPNVHGIWCCLTYDIKRLMYSSRLYVTLIVVCFVIWDHLAPINAWMAAKNYRISPWIYPFISSSVFLQMVIMGGILFMFSDSPFFSEMQPLLIIRIGRIQWCIAQLLYIAFASMIYLIAVSLVSMIIMLPHVCFDLQWGSVITALSTGNADIENVMGFSGYVISKLSPVRAFVLSLLFSWMGGVCIAEVQFFFNISEKGQMGSVIAGGIILQDLFSLMILSESSERYSMITLTRLSVLLRNETMFRIDAITYSFVVLLTLMLILSALCVIRMGKAEVYPAEHSLGI